MTYDNIYRKCGSCGQYINTYTTDHVVIREVDGMHTYLHMLPCFHRYVEDVDEYEQVDTVLRHQHRR